MEAQATTASQDPFSRSRQGSRVDVAPSRSRQGSEAVRTRPRGESYDSVGALRNDSRSASLVAERDLASLGSLSMLEASLDSLLNNPGTLSRLEGEHLFGDEDRPLSELREERSASWEGAAQFTRVARSGSLESCGSSSSGWSSSSDAEAGESARGRLKSKVAWTPEEDHLIAEGVRRFGNKWSRIVETLPTAASRTDDAVRNRWQRLQRKQKRQETKSGRGAKSYSDDVSDGPSKHGDMWTNEEDLTIDEGVKLHGFKWRAIAAVLPGRTESGCRNRWIRNQERALAARGVMVRGAQEVIAALHKSGELRHDGSSPCMPPAASSAAAVGGALIAGVGAGGAAAAASAGEGMDDGEPLFPPPPDEPLFPAAADAPAFGAPPFGAPAFGVPLGAHPAAASPAAYPWESSAAIQALRRDSGQSLGVQPEMMILHGP